MTTNVSKLLRTLGRTKFMEKALSEDTFNATMTTYNRAERLICFGAFGPECKRIVVETDPWEFFYPIPLRI